tara:strand:- start:118808 stop:119461 length:654 start_codon:yes stop_codon:yes gene_type:complete
MKAIILSNLVYLFVKVLNFTYRYIPLNEEVLEEAKKKTEKGNYLFGIWHQNLLGGIFSQVGKDYVVIVSASKDGQLVATTCEKLGYKTARGSSNRGGKKASMEMARLLKEGYPGAITVDGPKGPAHVPKKGIFELARVAGIPVVPFLVYPKSFWSIRKSWDQFRIPKPFTKLFIYYGEPIFLTDKDKEDSYDNASKQLIERLTECEKTVVNQYLSDA